MWMKLAFAHWWRVQRTGNWQPVTDEDVQDLRYLKGYIAPMLKGSRWLIKDFDYDQNPHVIADIAYVRAAFCGAIVNIHKICPKRMQWLHLKYKKVTQWDWEPVCTEREIVKARDGRAQTDSLCVQVHLGDLHCEYRNKWCRDRRHVQKSILAVRGAQVHGMLVFEHHPKCGRPFKLILDQWMPLNDKITVVSSCQDLGGVCPMG